MSTQRFVAQAAAIAWVLAICAACTQAQNAADSAAAATPAVIAPIVKVVQGEVQGTVVVVTVNCRLGRAGWFAHPALTAENANGLLGNYGRSDKISLPRTRADVIL